MKRISVSVALFAAFAIAAVPGVAQDQSSTLFTNVNVWDGRAESLAENMNVFVEGNMITQVSASSINANGSTVVDGGGRTLMPGLIDMHSHLCLQEGMLEGRNTFDQMAMGAMTGAFMLDYLDQGFTTTQDVGCNTLGIAKAVNMGRLDGPRIYPAGGWISQTGGHADTGFFNDGLESVDDLEAHGFGYIADGVPDILHAARLNFRGGSHPTQAHGRRWRGE